MDHIKLSICIPTYNRAVYLKECLNSIVPLIKYQGNSIELVISDNASTDATDEIINNFLEQYPTIPIKYFRRTCNIGPENNFYFCATQAKGEYIWIFGDDDKMAPDAIRTIMHKMNDNYDLYICNCEIWSSDFFRKISNYRYRFESILIKDHNFLLEKFYKTIGFISSIVIKRDLFLSVPLQTYKRFSNYGLSFFIAVCYAAVYKCNALFIDNSLVIYRGNNSRGPNWVNIFVLGFAYVFDELNIIGYSALSITKTKNNIIRSFILHQIIYERTNGGKIDYLFNILSKHYKDCWSYWLMCVPLIVMPLSLLIILRNGYKILAGRFLHHIFFND